jgi:hypothetical protein
MARAPNNFKQGDVSRAIRAAKASGLDIVRVDIDPKTARISVVVRDGNVETEVNPFRGVRWPESRRRKRTCE